MEGSDKELEKKLFEAGNRLLEPPASVDELLGLLDEVEICLIGVEQSPSESMKNALSPSLKALVTNELVRHEDSDVKVAVASCISEITRITAPDTPYDDDQMKVVFQLIVWSFEQLYDQSSKSYNKRITILETVAKVRSCVVMLDLECDALILELFHHFVESIRDYHPDNVFSSMETIMTLILDESEDISKELLSSILGVLKKDEEVLPIARKLGEKVIEKSSEKLKPCLVQAVKSSVISLDDYHEVLAGICGVTSGAAECNNGDNDVCKNMVEQRELPQAPTCEAVKVGKENSEVITPSEEVCPPIVESDKPVIVNGIVENVVEGSLVVKVSGQDPENDANIESQPIEEQSGVKTDALDETGVGKSESKPEKCNKQKGEKSKINSSNDSLEPSVMNGEKEEEKMPDSRGNDDNDISSSSRDDTGTVAAKVAENERESEVPDASPKASENGTNDVTSPSASRSIPDDISPEKIEQEKKDSSIREGVSSGNTSTRKATGESSASESESEKHTGIEVTGNEESTVGPVDELKKEDGTITDLDTIPAKQSEKTAETNGNQQNDKKERQQGEVTSGKDLEEMPSKDEDKDDKRQREQGKVASVKDLKETPSKHEGEEAVSLLNSAEKSAKDESKKEDGTITDLDTKPTKQSKKTVEESGNQQNDKKKREEGKVTSGKDLEETPSKDEGKQEDEKKREQEKVIPGKDLEETPSKDEGNLDDKKNGEQGKVTSVKGLKETPSKDEGKQENNKKKREHGKVTSVKDLKETPSKDEGNETFSLPKSAEESAKDESKKADGAITLSDTKRTKQSKKTVEASGNQQNNKKKREEGKVTSGKDLEETPSKDEGKDEKEKREQGKVTSGKDLEEAPSKDEGEDDEKKREQGKVTSMKDLKGTPSKDEGKDDKKKREQGTVTSVKDLKETPSKDEGKETVSLPKSAEKSAKDESQTDKTPKVNSKRKHAPGGEKASNTKTTPDLVGTRIKVWWPIDKQFYEGIIESFDPVKKKHKVVYNDGDIEVLNLKKQKWDVIKGDSELDQGQATDDERPEKDSEMQQKKKAKTNTDSTRQDSSAKKVGGASSSSKSKDTPSMSGKKQLGKPDSKPKDDTTKNVDKSGEKSGKSKDDKSGSKPRDDTPKQAGKSKVDDIKSRTKSKKETQKDGAKSSKGQNSGKKSIETLLKETKNEKTPENAKGKTANSSKSQKSESKNSQKRKRH